MHIPKSQNTLLVTTILCLLALASFRPVSAAAKNGTSSNLACVTCLDTAARTKSSACSKDPAFSTANWKANSNMTEQEKPCLCGLVAGGDEFWLRTCIAKPPSACSGQEEFTTEVNDALTSFKAACPAATTGGGAGRSGGMRESANLMVSVVALTGGIISLALL